MTPNWLTQYNFDRQANEAAQAAVNQAAQAGSTEEMLRAHVIAVADSFHLPYPQYANFWDGPEWGLMQAKRQIKTKGGVAFEPGDWTVVKNTSYWSGGFADYTAYSIRNRCNTAVSVGDFQERGPVAVFTCPFCTKTGETPQALLFPSYKLAGLTDCTCGVCGHHLLETFAVPADPEVYALYSLYSNLGDGRALNSVEKVAIFQTQHNAQVFRAAAPDTWTVVYSRPVTVEVDTAV